MKLLPAIILTLNLVHIAAAQPIYDIGSPAVNELWVSPTSGNDNNAGNSYTSPLRSVTEAWSRIPQGTRSVGYRVHLMPGEYSADVLPTFWENRRGSYNHPVIFIGADSANCPVFRSDVNMKDSTYIYFIGFNINTNGDSFHCEGCDHVLIRDMVMDGNGAAHETIKVNQSQHIYIEDSDISGSYENPIDYVAVQYGHIVRSRIHDGEDWCAYVKGGSAYIHVEGNRIYDCGTGGFSAGQGSGFEYLVSPWLHYEAYHITAINNLIYRTEGAGLGVNGGYNILFAHNTLYRVGSRSHGIEVVYGFRSCDGHEAECLARHNLGGWGPPVNQNDGEPIPDRNVYILNNVLYNPMPFRSAWNHLAIYGPRETQAGRNMSSPSTTDSNLRIRGNVLWNGPGAIDLGVGEGAGCLDSNPACNAAQLTADNAINVIEPQLRDAANGDFRPAEGGNLFSQTAVSMIAFPGDDRPTPPLAPQGDLLISVSYDKSGATRTGAQIPGAYASANASLTDPDPGDISPPPDNAPTVASARCTPRKLKVGKTLRCSAQATDDRGIRNVKAYLGSRYSKAMRLRSGAYRVSWKLRGVRAASYNGSIRATDTGSHITTSSVGRIKVLR